MSSSRLSTVSVVTKKCFAHVANLAGTSRSHIAATPSSASATPPDTSWLPARDEARVSSIGVSCGSGAQVRTGRP